MTTFASTKIGPLSDGVVYASNFLLPAQEGSLYSSIPGQTLDPIPTLFTQAVIAVITFQAFNVLTDQASYVILQSDNGDGNWLDLSWATFTAIGGSTGRFVLAAGAFAANSFQQVRQPGTPPSPANGSNSCPLGGRLRFVGQTNATTSGSSASSGPSGNGVYVNVLLKLIGLR